MFAPGVSLTEGWYDVNKAYTPVVPYWKFVIENGTGSVKVDSDRMKKEFPYDDTKHCSAAAASNLLHSWWDRNRAVCEELYGPVSGVRTAYTGSRDKYSAQNSEIFRWYIQHWQGVGNPFDVKMKQYFSRIISRSIFPVTAATFPFWEYGRWLSTILCLLSPIKSRGLWTVVLWRLR